MIGFFSPSTVQKDKPIGLLPKCGVCQLFKTCESPKMAVYGKGEKRVMVVGEAPGEVEDEKGRPFVGKSGQFLRDTLRSFDVKLDRDAWVTNAIICRPPKNKTPDAKQISCCQPNLLNAIRKYRPRVIVTLGRSALVSVMGTYWKSDVGPLERWVGWRIPLQDHWVCPTFHPAFLLRMKNPLMDRLFTSHLRSAFRIDREAPVLPDYEGMVDIVYDDSKVWCTLAKMEKRGGWMVVDYETNCIKPEWPKAQIVSCAVSNGETTISYPWVGKAIAATGLLLKSSRTQKIASNIKFEERWTLKAFGHGVTNWGWDTMLAAHCLDNRTGICSLKFQSLVKLGVPSYNETVEPYLSSSSGPYNRIRDIEVNTLLLYGGMDAILEYRLAMRQRKEMGYES